MHDAFLRFADRLIHSGHPTSIATRDADLVHAITARHAGLETAPHVEFEVLCGLGADLPGRRRTPAMSSAAPAAPGSTS